MPARAAASHPIRTAVAALALAAGVALVALMLLPALLGYQRYVIVSGSMTGTVDQGSIVYEKPVPTDGLRVGDIITYAPPAGMSPTKLVTHRIFAISRDAKGGRVFRTKGDHNPAPDPWTFTLDRATQPRMDFHVPYAGYAFAALGVRWVRMLLIGLPALLVALLTLVGLVREGRAESGPRGIGAAFGARPTVFDR